SIGGGGLASGVASYLKAQNPGISIIGAEPAGSPSMAESLRAGELVSLDHIDTFVDGVAVKRVGELTFDLCRRLVEKVVVVTEGEVCTTLIELYQNEGIVAEPAGALAVSALSKIGDQLRDKTVVCIL